MTLNIDKGKVGVLFEDFLKEQGIYEETTEQAVKRVLAIPDCPSYEGTENHEGGNGQTTVRQVARNSTGFLTRRMIE